MRTTKAQREAEAAKRAAEKAERAAIVASGTCPQCGAPLVRNITLSGWWQCAAYGTPGFRGSFDGTSKAHPEYDALPSCSFQSFV